MRARNQRDRARGARGKNRGRGLTTPLRDDSDDPEYTDAVLDGRHYEPEDDE